MQNKAKRRSKPRPYIMESKWDIGENKEWKFFRRFATKEAASETAESAKGKAAFVKLRLMFQGEELWVK